MKLSLARKNKYNNLITFTNVLNVSNEYAPKPASFFIPEWYKKMEASIPKKDINPDTSIVTIKKCIPVLDAMTAGYIIVTPCDLHVSMKDEEPFYITAKPGIIAFHPLKQAYSHPKANGYTIPKWNNPWAIKTPKGVSCLFLPPLHRDNDKFEILQGVVDTDTYSAAVNFPFLLKNPEKELIIPAGTPMAQVIPFRREEWISEVSNNGKEHEEINISLNSQFYDRYKHRYWQRKKYS